MSFYVVFFYLFFLFPLQQNTTFHGEFHIYPFFISFHIVKGG